MRQAVVRHQRGDVRQLGLLGAQELPARRHVVEKVAHRDGRCRRPARLPRSAASCRRRFRCACRWSPRPSAFRAAGARPRRWRAALRRGSPSVEMESRSLTSRSLLVAWRSKASRASSRSMPQPSSAMRISRRPPDSTSTRKFGRAGVERVLEQLLDHRGGPLHHFAGGDLVGDLIGKNADAAHARSTIARSGTSHSASKDAGSLYAEPRGESGYIRSEFRPAAYCETRHG